jgi:hypothetical protein
MGQGLPTGALGDQLPLAMRITQVADIAEVLHQVRNHIDHVFAKTGTSNRVGLSLFALANGLAAATRRLIPGNGTLALHDIQTTDRRAATRPLRHLR